MDRFTLHQSIEEIIATATAEQRILWNHAFLRFGERVCASSLHFTGTIATSEFVTVNANRMYLAYNLVFGSAIVPVATVPYVNLHDIGGGVFHRLTANIMDWDATAAAYKFLSNSIIVNNLLFSRMTVHVDVVYISFTGYRLTF